MNPDCVVRVRGVCKTFNGIIALNNLEMDVRKGDIYGFLGPNGSGKSTTIRMLLTLVKPEEGTIEIFGQNLASNRLKILKRIGAMVEKPGFYERVSALKNLEILTAYSGIKKSKDQLLELLNMVGLEDRAYSAVGSFSCGMKQRLGIVQAMMHKPELLLLDEPFAGLDPQGVKDMRLLIKRLNKDKGMTIIISSHQLVEIESIANRMIIINKGSVVSEGSVDEIISKGNLEIKIEVDLPQEAFNKLKASRLPIKNISLQNGLISLYCLHDAIPYVNQYLHISGFKVFGISQDKALENYYLTFT